MKIPIGNSKEDIKKREQIISDFYRKWYENNPSRKVYNINLHDYIHVKFISINETVRHAAKKYLSTLAVLQLNSILQCAKKYGKTEKPKKGVKNQEQFSEIIIMLHDLIGIGTTKLTVGIKRTNKEKIQYCITVLET